jgi:carbohydrate-binding DOMON domain-containing protein
MTRARSLAATLAAVMATTAAAQEVTFKDPVGDDKGPGTYTYPTDPVYTPGSFDIKAVKVKKSGSKVDFDVTVAAKLEDPWKMDVGFSVQMAFVFIDTGDKAAKHFTEGLPGLNVAFEPDSAWDKVVILSPQSAGRVKSEATLKAGAMKDAVVVPTRTRGSNFTITASADAAALGGGDPTKWRYQVVMQSNEGFPAPGDLLTRKVNEFEGQHRFGGGNDGDCDPHVMDVLAGQGKGAPEEAQEQYKMLAFQCNPDGTPKQKATLKLIGAK